MRTRRQGKQNFIVIFQRITTKDIKRNKKGTSTNPKPKILFLFLFLFFFPSSPVPHFSAALVIPSLNWNLAFLFPHFLTNKTNLPLLQPPTTECILTQLPMKTSRPWNPAWPDAWKAWLKLLLGLAILTRYSNTFKKNIYPARPHERDSDPIAHSDHRGLTRTLIGSTREPERWSKR